jgi:DNA-directed RNA polymerase subunit M/transcription elongation factor TFIIS
MFKFFFGNDKTDKMLGIIAEKTAVLIADSIKNNPLEETQSHLNIKKKTLEIELLKIEKDEKDEKIKERETEKCKKPIPSTKDDINNTKLTKFSWRNSPWSKLKREHQDFYKIALEHKEKLSPQAIQGMWQAYGQMRAARTIAFGAVVTTGVLGAALWLYQQVLGKKQRDLSKTENELNESKNKFESLKKTFYADQDEFLKRMAINAAENYQAEIKANAEAEKLEEINKSYSVITTLLEAADDQIKTICPDEKCYNDYKLFKDQLTEQASKEFDEKSRLKFFRTKNDSIPEEVVSNQINRSTKNV